MHQTQWSAERPLPPPVSLSLGAKVNDVVPWVLDVILNKHIISPNPHVRQAACIWLLSLVRKLSTHSEVKVGHLQARCSSAAGCL